MIALSTKGSEALSNSSREIHRDNTEVLDRGLTQISAAPDLDALHDIISEQQHYEATAPGIKHRGWGWGLRAIVDR